MFYKCSGSQTCECWCLQNVASACLCNPLCRLPEVSWRPTLSGEDEAFTSYGTAWDTSWVHMTLKLGDLIMFDHRVPVVPSDNIGGPYELVESLSMQIPHSVECEKKRLWIQMLFDALCIYVFDCFCFNGSKTSHATTEPSISLLFLLAFLNISHLRQLHVNSGLTI